MKRVGGFVLLLMALAFIAAADCRPKVNEVSLAGVSHGLWRGIDLGGQVFAEPQIDLGLCGRPLTTVGTTGVDMTVEGFIPISTSGTELATAQVRYLWYVGDSKQTSIATGYRESHWGDGGAHLWTGEVSIEARTKWFREQAGLTLNPFIEVDRDLNRFRAMYSRVGFDHQIGAVGLPISGELTAFTSASNYAGSFGWHDTEVEAWASWRLGHDELKVVEGSVGGGHAWVARDIGRSHAWVGLRLKMKV